MLCAFFLGAGNIIFPPSAGVQAGENVFYSMFGFLLTGVGLPLIGVIGIAITGGSLRSMTSYLPKGTGTIATTILFIVIGPAFATPRTSLVVWDLAIKPLTAVTPENERQYQIVVTSLFFVASVLFAVSRGKLIDNIGKILMPLLFLLLVVLAAAVVISPWGTLQAPVAGAYNEYPMIQGFLEGYNTMDAFAALMFGGLIVDILRKKGVTDMTATRNYLIIAGFIAALGLSFVYVSLFWLGATAGGIPLANTSGPVVLAAYVEYLFGNVGVYILSAVVILACLTTAVGLLSACADYFGRLFESFGLKLSYSAWVVIFALISAWVANVGLNALIAASVPSLYALYPMVITILALSFMRGLMHNRKFVYRFVMSISLVMGILAALRCYFELVFKEGTPAVLGVSTEIWQSFINGIEVLPLFKQNMEWVIPVLIAFILAFIIDNVLVAKAKKVEMPSEIA